MAAPHYGMPIPFMFVGDGSEKTFELEETLPSLPVPPLDQTLAKYLESDEYRKTESIVQKFASGVGKNLHTKLLSIAQHSRNWLFDWWEEYAYLNLRSPHAPYANFAAPLPYSEVLWPAKEGTQCERAALYTWYTLQFWNLVHKERLAIDRANKGKPLSMYQYYRMFNTCKVPGEAVDTLCTNFKTDREGGCPTHLVVICKGRFFSFEAVDSQGHVITVPELEQYFIEIRAECVRKGEGLGVGSLTAENRTEWFKLRNHLISLDPVNVKTLETIQRSLFIIVLEDTSLISRDEVFRESFIGSPQNRWFDKNMQIIFYKNGTIGGNGDHIPRDAMVIVVMRVFNFMGLDACGHKWQGPMTKRDLEPFKKLVFHVDDKIIKAVSDATLLFKKGGEKLEFISRTFTGFGKKFITENNLHADAFVQMALHYSYIRLHGKPAAGYETASTRKFYRGRTETLRSCTTEIVEWSNAMMDQKTTIRQRMELLLTAMKKHKKLMSESQQGQGCDRHLLGLQIISELEGLPLPKIYTDKAYILSGGGGNFILSTSYLGESKIVGGMAPMCKNGYGFSYSTEANQIQMSITRWTEDKTNATELYRVVCESLNDLKQLIIDSKQAKL